MYCLHCGTASQELLCENCRTQEILEEIFYGILHYQAETCENGALRTYVESFAPPAKARSCFPELFALLDEKAAEFCLCHYHGWIHDPDFEGEAVEYLSGHRAWDWRRQRILHDLFKLYLRNDFVKPLKWCEEIRKTDGLTAELYEDAAQFYAFIAEYDLADALADKILSCTGESLVLFTVEEQLPAIAKKLKTDIERYRTKKPYWPATEARRRKLAQIYDAKGISHPRVTLPPEKVKESDFQPILECMEDKLDDYCAFWCEEVFNPASAAKDIYQIAAVRVRGGAVKETFQSLICPWKSGTWQKVLSSKKGIDLDAIQNADDVDLVMKQFFSFVDGDTLVSTQALGNQGRLLSRAARYAGMAKIESDFLDLLDYAADCARELDMENNTREFLLGHFDLEEGQDAAGKALANVELYAALKRMSA